MDDKLIDAVYSENIEEIKLLLDGGVDPNIRSYKFNLFGQTDYTSLMYASNQGNNDIVELLLLPKYNTNVDLVDNYNNTSLSIASYNGYIEIVKMLLDSGANPNIKNDEDGNTALTDASENGYYEIVQMLLDSGADPNIKNKFGVTSYEYAFRRRHTEIAILLEHYMMVYKMQRRRRRNLTHRRTRTEAATNAAQQKLATMKGYEDQYSILSHMDLDLMENVSKHLSAMKLSPSVKKRIREQRGSPSVKKRIREQKGSGKRKSKRSKNVVKKCNISKYKTSLI